MSDTELDAVVVGAGLAGVYMLHRLTELGLTARAFEEAADVGGTWYWNRYPGARCDGESVFYSYSFSEDIEQEWTWTERFASQGEILRYVEHVVERLGVRERIRLGTRVEAAVWDESRGRWIVMTDAGESVCPRFLITATGCLSVPRIPDLPGLDRFAGPVLHTGRWPHEGVSFAGKRVGVFGTGSSGIQCIPEIAAEAESLVVFQRTPNFCLPSRNHQLDSGFVTELKSNYKERRRQLREAPTLFVVGPANAEGPSALDATPEERAIVYEEAWQRGGAGMIRAYRDLLSDPVANETAAEFVRRKIGEIVHDPDVAELLSPRDHPFGAKRLCLGNGYYETYNRDNVTLVDLRGTAVEDVSSNSVRLEDGAEHRLDVIVCATGYDAITGALLQIDIRGRAGRRLRDEWRGGPETYLGLAVSGFPNLFTITGPGSPSVLGNVVQHIEHHVDWIAECLVQMDERAIDVIEAKADAQARWSCHLQDVARATLFPQARSWYTGANIEGKPTGFMPYAGGTLTYKRHCTEVADEGYVGFDLRPRDTA